MCIVIGRTLSTLYIMHGQCKCWILKKLERELYMLFGGLGKCSNLVFKRSSKSCLPPPFVFFSRLLTSSIHTIISPLIYPLVFVSFQRILLFFSSLLFSSFLIHKIGELVKFSIGIEANHSQFYYKISFPKCLGTCEPSDYLCYCFHQFHQWFILLSFLKKISKLLETWRWKFQNSVCYVLGFEEFDNSTLILNFQFSSLI